MRNENSFERIVFLSDAIVAIAATLLILPLVDAAGEIGRQSTAAFLHDHRDQLMVFVLSFVVIARYWTWHHRIFDRIEGFTTLLVWLNFVWLITIAFLPFPTEIVGVGQDAHGAPLYIATLTVATSALSASLVLIARTPSIQREEIRGTVRARGGMITAATMWIALALTVFLPGTGMWPLLLLVPSGWAESWVDHRAGGSASVVANLTTQGVTRASRRGRRGASHD